MIGSDPTYYEMLDEIASEYVKYECPKGPFGEHEESSDPEMDGYCKWCERWMGLGWGEEG